MGGAVTGHGNITASAEFNVAFDPAFRDTPITIEARAGVQERSSNTFKMLEGMNRVRLP